LLTNQGFHILSYSQGAPWEQKYYCQSPSFDILLWGTGISVPYITEAGASGDIRSQAGAWERDIKMSC